MRQVEYIDSSGLAVLVSCLESSRKKSGDVCLFGMRDTVRALFELTRLEGVFDRGTAAGRSREAFNMRAEPGGSMALLQRAVTPLKTPCR